MPCEQLAFVPAPAHLTQTIEPLSFDSGVLEQGKRLKHGGPGAPGPGLRNIESILKSSELFCCLQTLQSDESVQKELCTLIVTNILTILG